MPGLRGANRGRGPRREVRRREPPLPRPRPCAALVGRHRLHLNDDESLPVGRALAAVARRARAGRNDERGEAERARARLVGRPLLARLGTAHSRAEPGDPRQPRSLRIVLAARLTVGPVHRYLELGLRLGRHAEELVDAYYGPEEVARRVDAEGLREPAVLAEEARELLAEVADDPCGSPATCKPCGRRRASSRA